MKLFLALQILLSASSYGPFDSAAKSIEEAVGSGCENHIELSSTFSTDSGEECNSCKLCDSYNMNGIFMPKGQGVCVECVSVDSSCKMFNVITSFSSPWSMKFLPYTATSMSSEYDPKSVFIYGSNDSVTWMELFKSDNTEILLKERSSTVEFIVGDNDQEYKFYKITFALKDGVTKMHLGHLGVVPALTKTCTAEIYAAITGGHVKLFDTLAPTQVPSDSPSDTKGYEFNNKQELKIAVDSWLTNEESASTQYGEINSWDVSRITEMRYLFKSDKYWIDNKCLNFNGDVSEWDVSAVTDMAEVFYYCKAFNGDLSEWNVAAVTNIKNMFTNAQAFNSNISDWDTSNVTNMHAMFQNAEAFDQVLCWDLSKVINTSLMFENSQGSVSPNYPSC